MPTAAVEQERTVDNAATKVEAEQRVRLALSAVSQRQKEVLVLRYYENLSYDHIAATLGISTEIVKSSISRGRRRLEQRLVESDDWRY